MHCFSLDVTLQGAKEDGFGLTPFLPDVSHLSVALERGYHPVHGSVQDVQEPIGGNDVPLYNFYLLFASKEFKPYLIVLKHKEK